MKSILNLLLIIVVFLFTINAHGQIEICGSQKPLITDTLVQQQFYKKSAFFDSVYASNYHLNTLSKTNTGGVRQANFMIPIRIWIIKNSSGALATTEANAFNFIDRLNQLYAVNNTGIQFFAKCEVLYNTDGAYYLNTSRTYAQLKHESLRDYGAINIHFVYSTPEFGGLGSFPSDDGFFGLTICAGSGNVLSNSAVLAHEIGHCLGLLHPHQGNNGEDNFDETDQCDQEAVFRARQKSYWSCWFNDDKTCEVNGDKLCDTEAQPMLLKNGIYKVDNNYTGVAEITEFDTIHKLVSGTFYFDALYTDSNQIVKVREGTFVKMKYN